MALSLRETERRRDLGRKAGRRDRGQRRQTQEAATYSGHPACHRTDALSLHARLNARPDDSARKAERHHRLDDLHGWRRCRDNRHDGSRSRRHRSSLSDTVIPITGLVLLLIGVHDSSKIYLNVSARMIPTTPTAPAMKSVFGLIPPPDGAGGGIPGLMACCCLLKFSVSFDILAICSFVREP